MAVLTIQFASCKHFYVLSPVADEHKVDIVASKIASFIIGFGLIVPAFRADHWMCVFTDSMG